MGSILKFCTVLISCLRSGSGIGSDGSLEGDPAEGGGARGEMPSARSWGNQWQVKAACSQSNTALGDTSNLALVLWVELSLLKFEAHLPLLFNHPVKGLSEAFNLHNC